MFLLVLIPSSVQDISTYFTLIWLACSLIGWSCSSNKFQSSGPNKFTVHFHRPLKAIDLPPFNFKPRVRKRNGRMSYRSKKYLPVLLPVLISTWDSVYSSVLPEPKHLHIPSVTYGPHFDKFAFVPRIYSTFLSSRNIVPSDDLHHQMLISQMQLPGSSPDPRILALSDTRSTPIVVDSGATFGTTPFVSDLIPGTIEQVDLSVNNLSGSSAITARGFGRWIVEDIHGNRSILEPYLHVVPKSDVRLFSPQEYLKGMGAGSYHMTPRISHLNLPNNTSLEIPYHHSNGLPMIFQPSSSTSLALSLTFDDLTTAAIHLNVADERNQNISAATQELVLKHRMCSHANIP